MNSGDNKLILNTETGNIAESSSASIEYEEHGTFCRVGSTETGFLEVDLQCIKQKGVENRNISFAIPLGLDENNEPVKAEMLFVNEQDFEKFKIFIAKLNWND